MASRLFVVFSALAIGAEARWFGMSPMPNKPEIVQIFSMNLDASIDQIVGQVHLNHSSDERVSVDAFRCKPGGYFCLLPTSNGTDSWLYNISTVDGSITGIVSLPGIIAHNINVYTHTSEAYLVALGTNSTKFIAVSGDGGITEILDLSPYLSPRDTVAIGGETQCSDNDDIWVSIRNLDAEPDRIIYFNVLTKKIKQTIQLPGYRITSMWSLCNDNTDINHLAGLVVNGSDVAMGFIDADTGAFTPLSTTTLPRGNESDPFIATGLLSQPIFADFFLTFYPKSSFPGGPKTQGYYAAGRLRPGNEMKVGKLDYYLTGVAETGV
eukprot:TRINITY_DN11917_c3_g4_i1.p2 TRINITY_DN11917_c3_g4~~TRINITY_DN11917_c3_g4_i1.p2  ORF type:complete len:324 (+),score=38.80 TRINITY_DN11917_c3_g4_i1:1371-2342(+)